MDQVQVNKRRGAQVLNMLREYGPLSVQTLEEILRPKMTDRRVREVTARLLKKDLIFRVGSRSSCNGSQLYEIRRARLAKEVISSTLGIPVAELEFGYVRQWEHRHGEQCARWSEYFRRNFPDCWVVRDWEFRKSQFLVDRLVGFESDRDLHPDLAICFERSGDQQRVVIGVEIERNLKKLERLIYKTRALVLKTQLDGVLFICDQSGIGESIRASFLAGSPQKSRRIGPYLENFLMFSSFDHPLEAEDISVANVSLKELSLKKWVEVLRKVPAHLRKNQSFEMPA